MQSPAGYRHSTSLTVRYADLDVLGHLNHAKYLTYMEQARIQYVSDVCQWDWREGWSQLGMILARAEIDYRLPVVFGDEAVCFTRCSRLGGKSFDLEYVLLRRRGEGEPEIAATAKTIMVSYNYAQDQTISVPEAWRTAMIAYEPELL